MSEFERLLQENLMPLRRYVHVKISNYHDAEDIIQDVCLAATQQRKTYDDVFLFKAYLIGIARHKCMDYIKNSLNIDE